MFLVVYINLLVGWYCNVVVGQWVCQFGCWVWSVVAECVDYLLDFVVVLGWNCDALCCCFLVSGWWVNCCPYYVKLLWGDVYSNGCCSVDDLCFDSVIVLGSDASGIHNTWGVAVDRPFHFVCSKVNFPLGVEVHAGFLALNGLGVWWWAYFSVGCGNVYFKGLDVPRFCLLLGVHVSWGSWVIQLFVCGKYIDGGDV